jgi:hypothetical protein
MYFSLYFLIIPYLKYGFGFLIIGIEEKTTAMPKVDFGRKEGQLSMSVAEVTNR